MTFPASFFGGVGHPQLEFLGVSGHPRHPQWLRHCAGAPKTVTDKLQRVLNAAARVVSDTRKFDRGLTSLLHDELHWLDVPERVAYKMGVMVYHCLHGQAPRYLADHLITASDVASRLRLRSANRHHLVVPRCRLNTYGHRAFFGCRSDSLELPA